MQDTKERVALTSIAASAGLTIAKGVVGLLSGSLAILSEAAHSLIDLGATVMTYFAVRISGKRADAAAAIVVAIFVCLAGWRLGRRTIETLTDTAPAGLAERVIAISQRTPGVVAVERVRAREAGGVPFVDLVVAVSRTLPLDRVT